MVTAMEFIFTPFAAGCTLSLYKSRVGDHPIKKSLKVSLEVQTYFA